VHGGILNIYGRLFGNAVQLLTLLAVINSELIKYNSETKWQDETKSGQEKIV
jgi:hypothetical protein